MGAKTVGVKRRRRGDPREITNCLLEHPDVAEAAALGVADDIYGEVPAAVVVIDAIPTNANGKSDRDALTALWARRTGRDRERGATPEA